MIKKLLTNLRELIYLLLGVFYYLLNLIFSLSNLYNLSKILLSEKDKYYSFSQADAGFRTWYDKIALDFKVFGRAGYSWDDGLGLSLSSRAYNNLFTYALVDFVGQLKLVILGRLLFVLSVSILVLYNYEFRYDLYFLVLLSYLLFFSPFITQIYTELGKPELFWWFLVPQISFFAFGENTYISAALWVVLAFVNAPTAFLVALSVMFSSFLYQSISTNYSLYEIMFFISICSLGVIKLSLRLLFMIKTEYLTIIGNEQKGLWKRKWYEIRDEWLSYLILITSIYASVMFTESPIIFSLLLTLPILMLHYLNWRMMYLNDVQSFIILFFSYSIGVATAFQSVHGLAIALLFSLKIIFIPQLNALRESIKKRDIIKFLNIVWNVHTLSSLVKKNDYSNDYMYKIFSDIPDNSRLVILTECRLRESSFRQEIEKLRFVLVNKRVTQVNDCYGCMQSSLISDIFTEKFLKSEDLKNIDLIYEVLKELHVKYVITFNKGLADRLIEGGLFTLKSKQQKKGQKEMCAFLLSFKFDCYDFIIKGRDMKFTSKIDGELILPFAYYKYLKIKDIKSSDYIKINKFIIAGRDYALCKIDVRKNNRYLMTSDKVLF